MNDIPRVVLRHVPDLIQCSSREQAVYRKKRRFIRFVGKNIESHMKSYDGDSVTWNKLDVDLFSRYEVLRHLIGRRLTFQGMSTLEKISYQEKDVFD